MQSRTSIYLTFLLLLLVTLTATAEDVIQTRGCRRGNMPSIAAFTRQSPAMLQQSGAESVNPYIGRRHQLVILAAFSDKAFPDDSLTTLQKWDKIFNQEGFCESPYVGSIHDYFYDQSYGQFQLSFDLQYITLGKCSRYASTATDDNNSQFLVNDIVDSLLKRDIIWSNYDWAADGNISQLIVIFAGKGLNDGGDSNSIWPHQWWLSFHDKKGEEGVKCSARTVNYEEKKYTIDAYCAVQSEGGVYNPFGTICHEYSHCFGLPDFYNGYTSFVFGWDLMDYGNYGGGGYCPTGYSAHERMLMGWLTPTQLTEMTQIVDMYPLHLKDEAYIIFNDACENEFYIIENRQKQLWDSELPNSGIVVFHINFDNEMWKFGIANSLSKQRYIIMPANNKSYSYYSKLTSSNAMWAYPYEENNQLTNTSSPAATLWELNSDSTYYMNKSITDISISDSLASFNFKPTSTGISTIRRQKPRTDGIWYNLSGQRMTPIGNESYSSFRLKKGIYISNGKKYVRY